MLMRLKRSMWQSPFLLSSWNCIRGKDDLVVTDNIATRYIYPNLDVKPLDDVRVREAINLAINREDLCKMVGEDTEPTVNFVAKRIEK